MQLIYRGINYQPQSFASQNLPVSRVAGKYRGVSYYICPKNPVLKQSLVICKYRGIDYIKRSCWREQEFCIGISVSNYNRF